MNGSEMRLSIITPTLNSVKTVGRAIDSVLSQDFEHIEHIVIDGKSTDGTLDVVKQYSQVKLISEPDSGIYDAMNKGIAASSGDWVYFLGSDDYFFDERVLKDLGSFFASDLDIFYGDIYDDHMKHRYDGPFNQVKICLRNISHQSIFLRRSIFQKIGLFDTSWDSYADWDHNMRWMLDKSIKKQYVDRLIAVYSGIGYSNQNPDLKFKRDRFYRYLCYGRKELPALTFYSAWGIDLGLGVLGMDLDRIKRCFSNFSRSDKK